MAELKGSKTHAYLKEAFAGESQANRRYLYFAKQADIEGFPDVGGLFRDTAEAETGHAHGHLDYLRRVGDPATDKPIGSTDKNLAAAVAGETFEYTEMYPGMAKTARTEGFADVAGRPHARGRERGPLRRGHPPRDALSGSAAPRRRAPGRLPAPLRRLARGLLSRRARRAPPP